MKFVILPTHKQFHWNNYRIVKLRAFYYSLETHLCLWGKPLCFIKIFAKFFVIKIKIMISLLCQIQNYHQLTYLIYLQFIYFNLLKRIYCKLYLLDLDFNSVDYNYLKTLFPVPLCLFSSWNWKNLGHRQNLM